MIPELPPLDKPITPIKPILRFYKATPVPLRGGNIMLAMGVCFIPQGATVHVDEAHALRKESLPMQKRIFWDDAKRDIESGFDLPPSEFS